MTRAKRTGNLTGPWANISSVRMKLVIKCNWKLDKSLLHLIWTVFVVSVFTVTTYTSFVSPSLRWQTSQLFSYIQCTKLFGEVMSSCTASNGELHADFYTGASSCTPSTHVSYNSAIMLISRCEVYLADFSQNRQSAKITSLYLNFRWYGSSVFCLKWLTNLTNPFSLQRFEVTD